MMPYRASQNRAKEVDMSVTTEYKTRKGALLAQLEHTKIGPGRYRVEGYEVLASDRVWNVLEPNGTVQNHDTLTDALEWIAAQIDTAKREQASEGSPRQRKPRKQPMSRADRRALGSRNSRRAGKRGAVLRNRRKGGA
jgi:hypothetical protein